MWHPEMGWSPRDTPTGMTLRDYLAAAALTGIISADDGDVMTPAGVSKAAYAVADAMIKAREAE